MSQGYQNLSNVASHAAGKQGYRENFNMMGMRGNGCAFPAPPPQRCYCMPAQFNSVDGRNYSLIQTAYGASRPCGQFN